MPDEPSMSRESKLLLTSLNGQREHVLGALEGLSDEALRRPVLPTGWTCVGLVHHLALDVEEWWFHRIVAGNPPGQEDSQESAWQVPATMSAEAVLSLYREQVKRANAIIAATPLNAAPAWWPEEMWPGWRLDDLREIILHAITETACHAGHLDAVRELIDGETWLVLT
ncbi:MAG TPA: DinB family protein [Streptosporangiaceae bacterium]|jgi:uncharacterized damage-inducible protein DinB